MEDLNESKCHFIYKKLEKDILASDLQFSFLVAAASSYRHDTVLRPFPAMLQKEDDSKEYKKLVEVIDGISGFKKLCEPEVGASSLSKLQLDLLHWTLNTRSFYLKSHPKGTFSDVQKLIEHTVQVPEPSHIFEVVHSDSVSEKFEQLRGNRRLLYACHGSRLENFHCILNYGLASHMNKNSLFGEGIYLSSELSVCMPYAPSGTSWKNSLLGPRLGCIAVCEIIDDPSAVKCQVKDSSSSDTSRRSRIAGSLGGEIPEKYYVVRNNDVLRIKYLLVYGSSSPPRGRKSRNTFLLWLSHNKLTVLLILYGLLLLLLGFYNSRFGQSVIKKYWSRRKH